MIIGIAGTLGAGKGTVVEYLKQHGFEHYSISGRLKEIVSERNLLATRENLSAVADELSEQYPGGILEVTYKKASESKVDKVILESIHRESEAAYLKSVGAIILGVDAAMEDRYKRAVLRQEDHKDSVTFEQFVKDTEREEEGKGSGAPNIRAVLQSADFVIHNDGSLAELHEQIDTFLKSMND